MNQQYTILTFAIIILTVVLFLSCDKKTVTEPENGEDPEPFIPKELTFSEPFSIPVETSYPALLAVTDVDLNGLPDLLVANVSGSLYLTVISNPGGEVPVQQNIRLPAVSDITAGDFTANGYPDVIVPTGISDGSWYILSNDGTGSFSIAREEQLDTNRASIISSAAGHFNQNGNLDISFLTSSRYPMGLHMYNNLGDLEFKHELFKEIGFAFEHTAYDITGNGFDDIVVYSDWFSSLYLIVNNGDGTFQDGRLIDLEGDVMAVEMADITGDGETEIVGISRRGTSGFVLEVIYPFASTEKIKDIYNIPFRGESRRLAICDLDGSGSNDIAILSTGMSYDFDSIIIYQNDGKGNLKNQNDIWNTDPERRFFYHIACADFDNDGRNDLALTISVNDEVIIYFNETDM